MPQAVQAQQQEESCLRIASEKTLRKQCQRQEDEEATTKGAKGMKGTRIVAVCVLAALTTCAAGTAPASAALPEYSGPFPKSVKSKSGPVVVETVSGLKATCTSGTNAGEV